MSLDSKAETSSQNKQIHKIRVEFLTSALEEFLNISAPKVEAEKTGVVGRGKRHSHKDIEFLVLAKTLSAFPELPTQPPPLPLSALPPVPGGLHLAAFGELTRPIRVHCPLAWHPQDIRLYLCTLKSLTDALVF